MTTTEPQPLLSVNRLADFLGVSVVTLWRMRKAAGFPKPIRISDRLLGWRVSEIQNWLDSRQGQ